MRLHLLCLFHQSAGKGWVGAYFEMHVCHSIEAVGGGEFTMHWGIHLCCALLLGGSWASMQQDMQWQNKHCPGIVSFGQVKSYL